jgi:hypothetical protein
VIEMADKYDFFHELEETGIYSNFGLTPKFYFLCKEKKQELFKKALTDYNHHCCLKSSMVNPKSGHYFGEMCHSCTVTAQILLYGFLHGFQITSRF